MFVVVEQAWVLMDKRVHDGMVAVRSSASAASREMTGEARKGF